MVTIGRFVINFTQVVAVEQRTNFVARLLDRFGLLPRLRPGITVHLSTGRILKLTRKESGKFFEEQQNHELTMQVLGMVNAGTKRI